MFVDTQPTETPVVVNPDRFLTAKMREESMFGSHPATHITVRPPHGYTLCPGCLHGKHRECTTRRCACACFGEFRVAAIG